MNKDTWYVGVVVGHGTLTKLCETPENAQEEFEKSIKGYEHLSIPHTGKLPVISNGDELTKYQERIVLASTHPSFNRYVHNVHLACFCYSSKACMSGVYL